ncbi:MAG TPA: hypothetical protein DEG88_11495 [Propionibacteriaceae bacterium]|nr:hypothetical protein [Propionibacteriaceae bacterium]
MDQGDGMKPDQRATTLGKAEAWLPKEWRARYSEEWVPSSEALAGSPAERQAHDAACYRLARRLRVIYLGQTLAGKHGVLKAVGLWLGLVVLLVGAFLLGSPMTLALFMAVGGVLVALRLGAVGGTASAVTCVALALTVVASMVYFWVAFGVGFDAADAGLPVPAWTQFILLALAIGALAFLGLIVALVLSVRRGVPPGS